MKETNDDVSKFTQFIQDFSPLVSGSEVFLSTLLTEKTVSQLLEAAKVAKNTIISDPKLTANLYALGEQNALLNKAQVLGVASDLLKSCAVLAPIVAAFYTDIETGNNDAGQKAIAIIAAVVAGVLDKYWDTIKDNTGGFLDDPEGFVRDIFENVPFSSIFTTDDFKFDDTFKENLKDGFAYAETLRSPLVLDLNGDGITTTNVINGNIYFDHDANGFAEKTGWINAEDGFLARDLNKNGVIDNGSELFGNYTVLKNGTLAANGFEALKDLDSNNDGVFDANDEAFHDVVVWRDANGNGMTDEGELIGLLQAGVSSVALGYNKAEETDENGNKFNQTGAFSDLNGTHKSIADIWFNVDLMNTKDKTEIEIPNDTKNLPNFKGIGNVHDLWTAIALDESGTLKSLLQDFINEPYENNRKDILDQIIYHWTGVADVEPDSRGSYGDARKLGVLEALLGRGFFGGGCDFWADPGEDPNTHAWPEIMKLYDSVKEVVYYPLLAQSTYKGFLDDIQFSWNTQNSAWEINFEKTMAGMTTRFENNIEIGHCPNKSVESRNSKI